MAVHLLFLDFYKNRQQYADQPLNFRYGTVHLITDQSDHHRLSLYSFSVCVWRLFALSDVIHIALTLCC